MLHAEIAILSDSEITLLQGKSTRLARKNAYWRHGFIGRCLAKSCCNVFFQEAQEDPLISSRKSHVKAQQRKHFYEFIWKSFEDLEAPHKNLLNPRWKSFKSRWKWWDWSKVVHEVSSPIPRRDSSTAAWGERGLGWAVGFWRTDLPWKLWEKCSDSKWRSKHLQAPQPGIFHQWNVSSNWSHRNGEFTTKWMQ